VCLLATSVFAQRVRVVHASPDAPAVDIRVDGAPAIDALPYGDATDYVSLPAGQRIFQVMVAGTDTQVTSLNATIDSGADYTVVAAGFATGSRTPGFRLIVLRDNNFEPEAGQARIRIVHAAASAPTVDIYYGAPYVTVRPAGTAPVLAGVPFGAASGYLTVPSNQQAFATVTPAGSKTTAFSGRLLFGSRNVRTIFALDAPGGGAPFRFLVLNDRN
jgi:hypothetical protein